MRTETTTREQALFVLTSHNAWRRGDDDAPDMQHPVTIGLAIDYAVAVLSAQGSPDAAQENADFRHEAFEGGEPLRFTREALSEAWHAGMACNTIWSREKMLAALQSLGINAEVCDGN